MKKLLLFSTILFLCCFLKAQSNFINQDSVFAQSADCTGGVNVCIDSIQYDNIGDYRFFLDGQPFTTTFESCTVDTFHTYAYSVIFQSGETGPFTLNSWIVDGQTYTIPNFANLTQLLDSMRRWDPTGNWQLEPAAQIIYGFPTSGRTYSCQNIRGLTLGGRNDVCYNNGFVFRGLKFRVPAGFHQFVVEDLLTSQKDTVTLRAACIQPDTVRQTVFLGVNRAYCVSTSQLLGTPQLANFKNFCAKTTNNVTFDSLYNFCISYTGKAVGSDTACVRVCDQYGICDTTYLYITAQVNPSRQHYITDTISVGLSRQKCDLAVPSGTIASYRNLACRPAGVNITFTIDSVARCVTYAGKAVGIDTACVEVCNTLGLCDTSFLFIQGLKMVPRGQSYVFNDTILIDSIRTKCDFVKPTGTISIFENLSAASSNVQFSLDQGLKCVSYRGLTVGPDTAIVRVCNSDGTCDTTTFYVSAKANTVQNPAGGSYVFNDTISINAIRQKCDIKMPTGTINVFQNICLGNSGSNVTFNLDTIGKCVIYSGKTLGIDTACIRVCNTLNVCDTTKFFIETKLVPVGGSSRKYNFNDTITVGLSRTKCDFTAPIGSVLIEKIGTSSANSNIQFDVNTTSFCVTYKGLKVGSDTTTIRICNATNICDTTTLSVRAIAPIVPVIPKPSVDTIKLKIFERKTYFPDSSELSGSPLNLIKFCTPANFNNTTISLDTQKKSVVVTGKTVGVDTFCIAICNAAGFCDTTTLYVQVTADTIKPKAGIDSVTLKIGQLLTYCPDSTELLNGSITGIISCASSRTDNSTVLLNNVTKCAEFSGISEGKDTACVILCNSAGLCDTTTVYIKVVKDIPNVAGLEIVNIKIGEIISFTKIDSSQILGAVDTIYDACPGKNGSHALMVLDRATRKVNITGVNVGSDTMCIVVYNRTSMKYDTTTIVANVRDSSGAFTIIANTDKDTMRQGRTITIKVYGNDTLRGRIPTSLTIIKPPLKGKADTISFRQGLISYSADRSPNACGLDSFTYKVCVDTVCSQAIVVIEVICADSLKAYNAISPNGDGRNDAFRIEGLQKYPNNTLLIYNRWGNEVLNVKKYQNDWQGTWNNKDLPDGTYFYMLRDEDTNEVLLTGYLQILR